MNRSKVISVDRESDQGPAEVDARSAPQGPPGPAESRFDPLRFCPAKARARFERRARLSADHPLRAIELKCLDCCGWDRPEAKRCEITSCPLWAMNQRIFGGSREEAPQ